MTETGGSEGLTEQEAYLIVSMRLYDVLMAIFMELAPEKAEDLIVMHQNGHLLGPLPSLNVEQLVNDVSELASDAGLEEQ